MDKILKVVDLKKSFRHPKVLAVDCVSFSIDRAKTLGLVGESGCGKSTLAKLILRLLNADAGEIYFDGSRIDRLKERDLKAFRRKAQIIFQEPLESLNPRMKVADILREPYLIHEPKNNKTEHSVDELLNRVGLNSEFKTRFPGSLSGGECQRVAIARAIALNPSLIICDEPVTSLDVIAQAQILNLLLKLQKETGVSYLFISHDLKIVRHMSDQILEMKDGRINGILSSFAKASEDVVPRL